MSPKFGPLAAALALVVFSLGQEPEFRKGTLYGHVEDADRRPVAGATVAVKTPKGRVLAWTTTDRRGNYALDVDPKLALNMKASDHRNLLEECIRAVGDVVMVPVKMVTDTGQTLKAGFSTVVSHNPAPLVTEGVGTAFPNPPAKSATLVAPSKKPGEEGEAQMSVAAPGFKDATVLPEANWLEGPQDSGTGLRARMETVKLAPLESAALPEVVPGALTLTEGTATPSMVPSGASVALSAKLGVPPGPEQAVRIFARESRRGTVAELFPARDGKTYSGTLPLDDRFPAGEMTISIAALRARPVEVRLPRGLDPLPLFVHRLKDMEPTKPYRYDPTIMASVDRLDVKVTVLPSQR